MSAQLVSRENDRVSWALNKIDELEARVAWLEAFLTYGTPADPTTPIPPESSIEQGHDAPPPS